VVSILKGACLLWHSRMLLLPVRLLAVPRDDPDDAQGDRPVPSLAAGAGEKGVRRAEQPPVAFFRPPPHQQPQVRQRSQVLTASFPLGGHHEPGANAGSP
jgi:hypothetical protein